VICVYLSITNLIINSDTLPMCL